MAPLLRAGFCIFIWRISLNYAVIIPVKVRRVKFLSEGLVKQLLCIFFAFLFIHQFSQASVGQPIQEPEPNRESVALGASTGKTIRDITYCKTGDTDLRMDAYLPPSRDNAPLPVLIYIHGGAWIAGDKDEKPLRTDLPGLLQRGYAVFSINYRLAPLYRFPAQIEDCKCAVRSIRANAKKYNIDPARLGVWGSSAGGHLATLLGVTEGVSEFEGDGGYPEQSSAVQAVATFFGPADLTTSDWSLIDKLGFLSGFGTSKYWLKASPVNYVTRQAPPFWVVVGDKDKIVSPQQGQRLFAELKSHQVQSSLLVVKNCGHEFAFSGNPTPSRPEVSKQLVKFFDQNIRPAKLEQSFVHTRPRRVMSEAISATAIKQENSRE